MNKSKAVLILVVVALLSCIAYESTRSEPKALVATMCDESGYCEQFVSVVNGCKGVQVFSDSSNCGE